MGNLGLFRRCCWSRFWNITWSTAVIINKGLCDRCCYEHVCFSCVFTFCVILPISLAVLPGVKMTPDSFRNWTKTESGWESCIEGFVGRPLLLVFFDSAQMKTHQYSPAIHLFNYPKRIGFELFPIYLRCDVIRNLLGMSSVESSSTVMDDERFFLRIIFNSDRVGWKC